MKAQRENLVSVIIINYNTFDVTVNCIRSVIEHTAGVAYEVILVDNASPTDNPDEFLKIFPAITLVKSKENGGFAKGNNIGIAASKGNIILLLNSDTVLTEDSISMAAAFLESKPDAGAVTVRLTYENGRLQHTARKFRSVKNELLDLFRPLLMVLPYKSRATLMMNQYFKGDFTTSCDWVSGAFMMFPATILEQMPGNKLDERFFMYGEDQLWCYQFKQLGYNNYYYADTTTIHLHAASTSPEKQLKLLLTYIDREIDLMRSIYGEGLYFKTLCAIYYLKEKLRYYIKRLVKTVFKRDIK